MTIQVPRTGRRLLALSLVTIAAVLVCGVFLVRTSGGGVATDPKRLTADLSTLRTADGLIATRLRRPDDALDATGWSWRLIHRVSLPDRPDRPESDAIMGLLKQAGPETIWNRFFAVQALPQSAGATRVEIARPLLSQRTDAGYFVEGSSVRGPDDDASRVLATWAAVVTLREAGLGDDLGATAAWMRTRLAKCNDNTWLTFHILDTIRVIGAKPPPAADMCLRRLAGKVEPSERPPRNEEELLGLVGDALVLSVAPPGFEHRLRAIRDLLEPDLQSVGDAWWLEHASRGFVAAGGDPARYLPATVTMAAHAKNGLFPQYTLPESSIDQVYLAGVITREAALPLTVVADPDALTRLASEQGDRWGGVDYAMWFDVMRIGGLEISNDDRARMIPRIEECADTPITPGGFRATGVCRQVVGWLGLKQNSSVQLDAASWIGAPDEAWVEMAATIPDVSLDDSDRLRVAEAIDRLTARLPRVPTVTLCSLSRAAVAARHKQPPRSSIFGEVERRRGDDEARELYRLTRTEPNVDLAASLAAIRWKSQER